MSNFPAGTITKNTSYLLVSYIGQKFLVFAFFVILARFLSVAELGKYVFAFSFTTVFAIFIDLGLSQVLTREIAKIKEKTESYLSNILSLKLIMATITFLAVTLLVNILNYPILTKNLVYLSGLVMILDSFSLTFYAVLRGIQNLKFEALGTIYYQILIIVFGSTALFLKATLPILVGVYVLASIFNFLYSFWQVNRHLKISLKLNFDTKILKFLFAIALPFALAGIFNRLFYYFDTILLSKTTGDSAVAIYNIAIKLTYSLQFIPAALAAALFPAMSSFYLTSQKNLKKSFERSFLYLSVLVLPIIFGTIALAPEIIRTLYGEKYLNSILPLQILIMALIFIFLNYPIGSLLNSCNKQIANTANIGIATMVNVTLNFILIPGLCYVGSALAALLSQFVWFILGFYEVNKLIKIDNKTLGKKIILIFLSSTLMFFVILIFKKNNWFLVGGFSTIFYFILIVVFRVIKIAEIKELMGTVIKK